MILLWLLLIPFLSGLLSLVIRARSLRIQKLTMCSGLVIFLVILGVIARDIVGKSADDRWLLAWQIPWIEAFNINFSLGLSGLSFWLIVLTGVMGLLALFIARPKNRVPAYYAALSWAIFGMVGVFLATDVFLFFIFWEAALLPVYWMILAYGRERRTTSALRYIFYTQISGLFLLVSILGLVFANAKITGILSFDYHELKKTVLPNDIQHVLLIGFLMAFLIKLPVFPFHTWMPLVFTEAPVAIILVGVLVKTAVFGLLRFTWPLFPDASANFAIAMMSLGAFTTIYGAVLAFGQSEPKRMLAYGTLSHVGLILIGVFCDSRAAFFGVFLLLITQCLSTGGTLMLISHLYRQTSTISLDTMGGLWRQGPKYSVLILGFLLAGIGSPTFGNFIGEWLVLWGSFTKNPMITVFAGLGIVFGAVYSLWLFQRLCFGKASLDLTSVFARDLTRTELTVYGLMMVALLVLGIYPSLILHPLSPPTFTQIESSP